MSLHSQFAFVLLGTLILLEEALGQGYSLDKNVTEYNNRKSKFLMSITVPPTPCGASREGVCLPAKQCARRGGSMLAAGNNGCSNGFGECCGFTATCNATTTDVNINQFVTTLNAPMPISTACSFLIKKQRNVCQISVRFISYTSASANTIGFCDTDSFVVRGSSTVDEGFTTCGNLGGQHMFLTYGNSDTIQLRPSFTSNSGSYSIIVTQIPCNSPSLVPDYCLQHFLDTTGMVTSFDYPNQQQNNQRYQVCAGPILNSPRRISWTRCMAQNSRPDASTFFINGGGPANLINCNNGADFVQINGRNQMCEFPNRPAAITSSIHPATLNVNFNDHERIQLPIPADLQNLGQAQCQAVTVNRPDLAAILQCNWQVSQPPTVPPTGVCVCALFPAFIAFFGESDWANTGFCLEYTQT